MLCLPRNANLSQPERRYGPRRRHSEGGEFGRRAGEFMCLAQLQRRATFRGTESKSPADCPGRSTSRLGKNSPNMNTRWGKRIGWPRGLELAEVLSKRAGQELKRADIGWPREQADDTRAHLLDEEEGGGKGPDPLTII